MEHIKIVPLNDKVVVSKIAEDKSASLIVTPDSAEDKICRAKVVAVGNGLLSNGVRVFPSVSTDDIILFNTYAGSPLEVDNKKYILLREEDILCKLCNIT